MRAAFAHLLHWRTLLGLALGGGVGVAYALTIGCATGTCPLTSNPVTAGLFGALLGATLLAPAKRQPPAPSSSSTPTP